MRIKLLSCEVFAREIASLLKEAPQDISLQFFSKGLHEIGCALMRQHLQDAIDWTSSEHYDAIALAYGMCGLGTVGLKARTVPVVLPRAHDCISILLGSHQRHEEYLAEHPGAYFRSSGWLERRVNPAHWRSLSISEKNSLCTPPVEFAKRFGIEQGDYLAGILCDQTRHYDELAFIEMGIEPDDRFERESRAEAEENGWEFQKLRGEMRLLRDLLWGNWREEDFLVIQPGREMIATYGERLVTTRAIATI
jgi:hypothetical protein